MTCDTPSARAYRIVTNRLVLRCWIPEDAELLQQAIGDSLEHLRRWMPWAAQEPESVEAKAIRLRIYQTDFEQGRDFVYGIFSPDQSRVLGGTGLHTRLGPDVREIGYWIHRDFINQGLATESTAALVKVAFCVDRVGRVEIRCDLDNPRSAAIPRKLAFRRQSDIELGPVGQKKMVWTMSHGDFPDSLAARAHVQAFDDGGSRIDLGVA